MTKKEMYAMMKSVITEMNVENKAEMLKFIDHEVELLEKKSSKSGQTKTQKANEVLKMEILEEMAKIDMPVTVSDFQAVTRFKPENDFSNQKISALLNQLVKSNQLVKTVDKKKSYFSIVK